MGGFLKWVVPFIAVVALHAQVSEDIRRATITGSQGSSGRCTIEVRVDIAAEVDIYGDSGRLRTLAGQPATWTRLECTDALPYNMSSFRFRGIDGRGDVRLLQDPRNNNSVAVIRIDDPRGGAEGYKFEIEWSGASGGAPTGGFATSAQSRSPTGGRRGLVLPGRASARNLSYERAMDLCRAEVHTRLGRDYGLSNVDIIAVGVDTGQGRRDWITGTFIDISGGALRGGGYRFNCQVDYSSGQVATVQFLRPDGSALQPAGASGSTSAYGVGGYDQTQVLRACQDAVVARANRDGYQNISFTSAGINTSRGEFVSGAITASRGVVTDTFDFGCSMDFRTAQVRGLEFNRR